MGLLKLKTKISLEDYLKGEKITLAGNEFVEGEVFAMAEMSNNRSRICINLTTALSIHLRDSNCELFAGETKVRVTRNAYYYPDVLVSCEDDSENPHFRNAPNQNRTSPPTSERCLDNLLF